MVLLYDLLDNCKAESDAFVIHVGRPLQLSESREQFGEVLFSDAFPSVFYLAS